MNAPAGAATRRRGERGGAVDARGDQRREGEPRGAGGRSRFGEQLDGGGGDLLECGRGRAGASVTSIAQGVRWLILQIRNLELDMSCLFILL